MTSDRRTPLADCKESDLMKTIVLDDDPTGTQSATGVTVLLESDAELLTDALRHADSVYVQTNSRALDEAAAVALARRIRVDGEAAGAALDEPVRFVLRGDSTLRGHVFAESEVFLDEDAGGVLLFVPAFPDGGRTTRAGVHYVRVDGHDVPAHHTEYAEDPVFPFASSDLAQYVAEKSGRRGVPVALDVVRAGGLADVLTSAAPGTVVVPDAVNADDIRMIAAAVDTAIGAGASLVIRSAAPLAAELAGVASDGLLPSPLVDAPVATLLVCGSHTAGAAKQLAPVAAAFGEAAVVDTEQALAAAALAGLDAADRARQGLADHKLAVVTSERVRSGGHNTLEHGERVMTALTTAVRTLLPEVSAVVAKGGITSAEVARTGIGASSAYVLGQILPGVSVWRLNAHDGRELLYVVVPGNVGDPDTLVDVLAALRITP